MRGDLNTLHAQHKRQMKYTTRGKQLINFSVNFYSYQKKYNDNKKGDDYELVTYHNKYKDSQVPRCQ